MIFAYIHCKFCLICPTTKRALATVKPCMVVIPVDQYLSINTCRSRLMKVDNHKKSCDRLLSKSDICQVISIEFNRQ